MITSAYEAILIELSEALKIKKLAPDLNNSCLLKMKEGVDVQIEPDPSGERLIMGSKLGNIPPGAFRTNIFLAALQTNALFPPQVGVFAWSDHVDEFILFAKIPMRNLNGTMLHDMLKTFTTKAASWKKAIDGNQVPIVQTETNKIIASRGGLFGLRP